jgi:flagellum-specific ATP synthase
VILSRRLADAGHFPAIDIEASVSRAMLQIATAEHQQLARAFRQWYSLYEQNRDLLAVGAYKPGTNRDLDNAVAIYPRLREFLRQDMRHKTSMEEALAQLEALLSGP